jgi:hypothetical protein
LEVVFLDQLPFKKIYEDVDFFSLTAGFLNRNGRKKLLRHGNTGREAVLFPLPFFVFNEKIRTKAVSCKSMTMVSNKGIVS